MLRACLSLIQLQRYASSLCASTQFIWWLPLAFALAVSPALPVHAEQFPYTAVIDAPTAIHAGPGEQYYKTDKLDSGAKVEVYRHDQDGWCAIRPPAGNFSWIAAEHLEITDNPAVARVINVPVKTRIGSKFSNAHDVEYISLQRGEIVELLGSQMLRDSPAEQPIRWFKVAPPSGEFRWVHSSQMRSAADVSNQPVVIETFDLPASGDSPESVKVATPHEQVSTGFIDSSSVQTVSYEEETVAERKTAIITSQPEEDFGDNAADTTHVNAVTWEAVAAPNNLLSAPEPRSFYDQYNALNVMLSRAVLEDVNKWRLDKLLEQTSLLRDQAQTPDETAITQALLEKIEEFQSLQQRSRELNAPQAQVRSVGAQEKAAPESLLPELLAAEAIQLEDPDTDDAVPTGPEMPQRTSSTKSSKNTMVGSSLSRSNEINNDPFDATGVLIAVQSRRKDLPRYALTNEKGQIIKFVTSKDGASLAHLVNQHVGVLGQLGYLRKFNQAHVVADRVVKLQRSSQ